MEIEVSACTLSSRRFCWALHIHNNGLSPAKKSMQKLTTLCIHFSLQIVLLINYQNILCFVKWCLLMIHIYFRVIVHHLLSDWIRFLMNACSFPRIFLFNLFTCIGPSRLIVVLDVIVRTYPTYYIFSFYNYLLTSLLVSWQATYNY